MSKYQKNSTPIRRRKTERAKEEIPEEVTKAKNAYLALCNAKSITPKICLEVLIQFGQQLCHLNDIKVPINNRKYPMFKVLLEQYTNILKYIVTQIPKLRSVIEDEESEFYYVVEQPELHLVAIRGDSLVVYSTENLTPEICLKIIVKSGFALSVAFSYSLSNVKDYNFEMFEENVKMFGGLLKFIEEQTVTFFNQ